MKLSELHQLNELTYIDDIEHDDKNWATGSHMLGKKLGFNIHDKCVMQHGPIGSNFWVLAKISLLPDPLFAAGTDYLLIAATSEQKVQCVAGLEKIDASWEVDSLTAVDNSSIPANKMYAAFVTAGNILTGSSQSEGGIKVWQKLSKEPGVVVYGWDKGKKEPINLGKSFNDDTETHVDDNEMFNWNMSMDDHEEEKKHLEYLRNLRQRVILVASQKGKKKIAP